MTSETRVAEKPFEFYTLAHVSRQGGLSANTLRELLEGLKTCSDESIYHHTVVTLRSQFASGNPLRNDYAQWADTSIQRSELAAALAALDEREYESIAQIRNALCQTLRTYLESHPEADSAIASNPFHFCEGVEVRVPLDATARTLGEFRRCLQEMNGASLYLHFIAPRMRPDQSSDFSLWLRSHLGLRSLADRIDEIDFMEISLEEAKARILTLIDEETGGDNLKLAARSGAN
jgi:hypothetical protein